MSCGMSQLGKKGFAAYSANVNATMACELMNENIYKVDIFSSEVTRHLQITSTRVKHSVRKVTAID